MSQFLKALNAARSLLSSGTAFHAAMAEHVNRAGHVPARLINELARVWAKKYDCKATITDTGWRFTANAGGRHDAAQRQWDRQVRAYDATPRSGSGGARSASKDGVARLIEAYKKLSGAEKRRFKALI